MSNPDLPISSVQQNLSPLTLNGLILFAKNGARSRTRTGTELPRGILSPLCLPISPPGLRGPNAVGELMHTQPCQVIRLDAPCRANALSAAVESVHPQDEGGEYSEVVRSGLQLRRPDKQFFTDSIARSVRRFPKRQELMNRKWRRMVGTRCLSNRAAGRVRAKFSRFGIPQRSIRHGTTDLTDAPEYLV